MISVIDMVAAESYVVRGLESRFLRVEFSSCCPTTHWSDGIRVCGGSTWFVPAVSGCSRRDSLPT